MELLKQLTERTKLEFRLDPLMNNKYNLMVKQDSHHYELLRFKKLKEILISLEFTLKLLNYIRE